MDDNFDHFFNVSRGGGRMDTKKSSVRVGVIVRGCAVHPVIPVQYVRIKSCIHPFSRASGTETSASAHHHVQNAHGDKVCILMRTTFQTNDHVRQLGKTARTSVNWYITLVLWINKNINKNEPLGFRRSTKFEYPSKLFLKTNNYYVNHEIYEIKW